MVVVSKTFTTAETMLNARTLRQWLWDRMSPGGAPSGAVTAAHVVACASESAAARVAAFGVRPDRFFQFWDWVGGRYSVRGVLGGGGDKGSVNTAPRVFTFLQTPLMTLYLSPPLCVCHEPPCEPFF